MWKKVRTNDIYESTLFFRQYDIDYEIHRSRDTGKDYIQAKVPTEIDRMHYDRKYDEMASRAQQEDRYRNIAQSFKTRSGRCMITISRDCSKEELEKYIKDNWRLFEYEPEEIADHSVCGPGWSTAVKWCEKWLY